MFLRHPTFLLLGLLAAVPHGRAWAQAGRQFAVPLARGPGLSIAPGLVSPGHSPGTFSGPALPVAPPVPGVLSDRLPPRYDGLALGHGQFSNQPAPFVPDRPALTPRQYQRDLLDSGGIPVPNDELARGNLLGGSSPVTGYGSGYGATPYDAIPYAVPYGAAPMGRTSPVPFGSSARIDGE